MKSSKILTLLLFTIQINCMNPDLCKDIVPKPKVAFRDRPNQQALPKEIELNAKPNQQAEAEQNAQQNPLAKYLPSVLEDIVKKYLGYKWLLINTLENSNLEVVRLPIALSHDSKFIVSISNEGSIRTIDKNKNIKSLNTRGMIKKWSLKDGELKCVTLFDYDYIYSIAISHDNQFIICGGTDKIYIFDFKNPDVLLNTIKCHTKNKKIDSIAISLDDKFIVCGSFGSIIIFALKGSENKPLTLRTDLKCNKNQYYSVKISDDNLFVITYSRNWRNYYNSDNPVSIKIPQDNIQIWDLKTGTLLYNLSEHESGVNAIIISNNQIISGSSDCNIKIWDLKSKKCIKNIETGYKIHSLEISKDNKYLYCGGIYFDNSKILIFDLESYQCIDIIKCPSIREEEYDDYYFSLALSKDNKHMVTNGCDDTIKTFEYMPQELCPVDQETYYCTCNGQSCYCVIL